METRKNFRERTKGMTTKEKAAYVLTYYWYYILLVAAAIALPVFFVCHFFAAKEERPQFLCALVNQELEEDAREQIVAEFAACAELEQEKVVLDASYQIAYEDMEAQGLDLSNYQKFFFQWENGELDAVILPEHFLNYCVEAGGGFLPLSQFGETDIDAYEVDGVPCAVYVKDTLLGTYLTDASGDALLLAFPDTGKHTQNSQKFIRFVLKNQDEMEGEEG